MFAKLLSCKFPEFSHFLEVGDTSGAEIYLQYHSIIIPFTKVIFSWFQQD